MRKLTPGEREQALVKLKRDVMSAIDDSPRGLTEAEIRECVVKACIEAALTQPIPDQPSLTEEKKAEYLKNPNRCPYCGSDNIQADHFDPEGKYVPVECLDCEREWREIYKLVDIEESEY